MLEGCRPSRPRGNMLPKMTCDRAAAIVRDDLCLERADGKPRAQAQGMHAVQKALQPNSRLGQQSIDSDVQKLFVMQKQTISCTGAHAAEVAKI